MGKDPRGGLMLAEKGWSDTQIKEELDAIWDCHRDIMLDWIREILDDYVCPDCDHRGR